MNSSGIMTVLLTDVRMYGYHGVFPQERIIGNEFVINLKVSYHTPTGNISDNLSDTISYVNLYEIVKEIMAKPCDLIESVAINIVNTVKSRFPQIQNCICKITKVTPPITGFDGKAEVEYQI